MSWEPLSREPDVSVTVESVDAPGFAAPPAASYQSWPPVAPDEPPRRSRGRFIALVTAAIGGSLTLALLCAGALTLSTRAADGDLNREEPAAPPTFSLPDPTPFNGVYVLPENLCQSGDFSSLSPLFYKGDQIQWSRGRDSATGAAISTCDGNTGNAVLSGAFHLSVSVFLSPNEALRAFKDSPAAADGEPISDLGQAAYLYRDPTYGLSVFAVDYNLTIVMAWRNTVQPNADDPERLRRSIIGTARSTLSLLRFG